MNLTFASELPQEAQNTILERGGFCHRLPLVAPIPVQGALGQPDMVVISAFGMCQKNLCPKWDGEKCSEAELAHVIRLRNAANDAKAAEATEAEIEASEAAAEGEGGKSRLVMP